MKKLVPFVAVVCFVLMLSCGPKTSTQEKSQPAGQETNQGAVPASTVADFKTSVTGQLIGSNGESQVGKELLLIEVRLVNLKGKEIATLPPKGTYIIDANINAPVATAQTDPSGRFEFKGMKPGRYSIIRRPDAGAGRGNFLQSPQSDRIHLFFDVTSGQAVELGKVREKQN
jgi:hypothetical protein